VSNSGWVKTRGSGDKFTGNTYNNGESYPESQEYVPSQLGRWTSNLVLQNTTDCRKQGTKTIKEITGTKNGAWRTGGQYQGGYKGADEEELGSPVGFTDENGMEEVENWICADGCPVAEMDKQGQSSRFFLNADWSYEIYENLVNSTPFLYQAKASRTERDGGLNELPDKKVSFKNSHPTVKSISLGSGPYFYHRPSMHHVES
jgi:hypothetical protein